jgi:hypothetical protein
MKGMRRGLGPGAQVHDQVQRLFNRQVGCPAAGHYQQVLAVRLYGTYPSWSRFRNLLNGEIAIVF